MNIHYAVMQTSSKIFNLGRNRVNVIYIKILTNNKYLDKKIHGFKNLFLFEVAFENSCPKIVQHQHPAIRHSTSYMLL